MADYFPLISRAVAGLDPNTADRRQAIYARARAALDKQLTSLDPPISPEDLARERATLADAVMRVEATYRAPPQQPVAPPPPPPPVASPPAAMVPPRPAPAPPAPPQAPLRPSPASASPPAPPITSASIPRPQPPQPARPVVPSAPPPRVSSPAMPVSPAASDAGETETRQHVLIDPTEPDSTVVTPPRPKVTVATTRSFARRKGVVLGVAVGIPAFLAVGALAYLLRDDPSMFRPQNRDIASTETNGDGQRKASGRLDGSGSAPVSGPRRAPAQDGMALPVATRVLYFEETTEDPRGKQSDGQVVWRLETVPGTTGQPPVTAVRGSVTVPDAKMGMEMTVRPNREASLPASHTVEIVFKPEGGRESVAEIGPIEARDQETAAGYQLKGAMVPVSDNFFLVGLDRGDATVARNLEAMRDRRWFAFQFRLKNNRVGAILIEKGQTGDKVFKDATEAWSR